jgi:molybdate transport system substrate-binding protein
MSTGALKLLAGCASALAMFTGSAQAAATITIAVTPIAANAIADLVADFQGAFSASGYTVSLVVTGEADAEAAILAGGASGPYDLLLAQSPQVPRDLATKYPSLVTGSVFSYAKDTLVLYSTTTNISAGAPTKLQSLSIPDPATLDPYGRAAVQALKGGWLYAVGKNLLVKAPDAASSYAAVEYLGTPYGFTGKSQICTAVTGVEEYEFGSYHHEYSYGVDYATDLVLAGVKVARTRTTAQSDELTAFIGYLTGAGAVNFTQHCFKLP